MSTYIELSMTHLLVVLCFGPRKVETSPVMYCRKLQRTSSTSFELWFSTCPYTKMLRSHGVVWVFEFYCLGILRALGHTLGKGFRV